MLHKARFSSILLGAALLVSAVGPVSAADPATTLRLATSVGDEGPYADLIRAFAEKVATDSQGSLTIEPIWSAQGDRPNGGDDRAVVEVVTSGAADMALAPSRAFDTSGSKVLQALQTPFLIDNDALAAAVATGDVGARILDGLGGGGLVGLSMWPDGLRHLLTFELHPDPFVDPAQLVGQRIRSVTSDVSWDLLKGYGATVSQKNGFGPEDYEGEEQSLDGRGEPGRSGTANVTFFPRFQLIVVDDAALARLTPDQQDVLREAAVSIRDQAMAAGVSEADAGAQFCADGGRLVNATDDQVAAFKAGAQPVIAALTQGAETQAAVAAIAGLKASTTPSAGAAPCEPGPPPAQSSGDPTWTAAPIPDGTYRALVTFDDLVSAGATSSYASNNAYTWTWKVENGETSFWFNPAAPCDATTVIGEHVLHVTFPEGNCEGETLDIQWEPVDGGIAVTVLDLDPPAGLANERALFQRVWERIE